MKKLTQITKTQISQNGVQSLADRPNFGAQYGVGDLSAAQLKVWFDKLASLLAEKINDLQKAIADANGEYIGVDLNEIGIDNLKDLIDSMKDTTFAEEILKVNLSLTAAEPVSLQYVVNQLIISESNRTVSEENRELAEEKREDNEKLRKEAELSREEAEKKRALNANLLSQVPIPKEGDEGKLLRVVNGVYQLEDTPSALGVGF